MIVRPAVGQYYEQFGARFLPQQLIGRVADGGAEPCVVLERNAADAPLDLVRVLFRKVLDDIKLYVAAALTGKAVYRIHVADRFECLAHQNEPFLFDLDDPPTRMRVRLQRIAGNGAGGRAGLVEQQRNGDITLFAQAFGVDILGLLAVGPAIDDKIDQRVQIVIFAVEFAIDPCQIFRFHQLKLMPDRRNNAAITCAGEFDKGAVAELDLLFDHAAPADAVIVQLAVPFVVGKGDVVRLKSLLGHLALRPRLRALQFVRLALIVEAVPCVEQVRNVLGLFWLFAFHLILGHRLSRVLVIVGKLALVVGLLRFGLLILFWRDRLKERVNAARRHYRIRHGRSVVAAIAAERDVLFDDGLDLGHYLAVELSGVVGRTAAHGYLKQKLERHLMHRQVKDIRPVLTQKALHQVEVLSQSAIAAAKPAVDPRVLHRAEYPAGEPRFGKRSQHRPIIRALRQFFSFLTLFGGGLIIRQSTFAFLNVLDITRQRECVGLVGRRLVKLAQLGIGGLEFGSVAFKCAKFDLSGAVSGEHLVEPKVHLVVIKLGHRRRQIDRLAVTDPRFLRQFGDRGDLDLLAGQRLDVHSQDALHLFEGQSGTRLLQPRRRLAGFEGKIATACL